MPCLLILYAGNFCQTLVDEQPGRHTIFSRYARKLLSELLLLVEIHRNFNLELAGRKLSMNENQREIEQRINLWRTIIKGDQKSWVLFEHGTCLILMQPEADLAAQAQQIMSTWGTVIAGSAAADFNVISLPNPPGGWIVVGHHPDMINYIASEDLTAPDSSRLKIGLLGRENRDQDAHSLKIVHVEDKRVKI